MKPTANQQAAIEARGADALVVASAGSGKTETLAARCAALVTDRADPCDVEQLLVVTFTRAAAAELRGRIGRRLTERLNTRTDESEINRLRTQIAKLDGADIGTIDAWCKSIVRSNFASAGVDPNFALLGENGEPAVLRARVMDELFEWIYSAADNQAGAARDWLRRNPRISDEFLRELVGGLNREREHLLDPTDWLARQRAWYSGPPEMLRERCAMTLARGLQNEAARQLRQIGGLARRGGDARVDEAFQKYEVQLRDWASIAESQAAIERAALAIDEYVVELPRKLAESEKQRFEIVRKKWFQGRLQKCYGRDAVTAMIADAPRMAGLVVCLIDLEARFEEGLAAEKRGRAAYEFSDVMRMALNLVGMPGSDGHFNPTTIGRRIAGQYRHVLVDEYQDTSPIQVELLRLVAQREPGNRFLVGDIKQSIYGFRQAKPELFAEEINAVGAGRAAGRILALNDSFRTHAQLLSPLNGLFERLFEKEMGGTEYDARQRLTAKRQECANPTLEGTPRLRIRVLEATSRRSGKFDEPDEHKDGDGTSDDLLEKVERESVIAASEIKDLLARGAQIPRRDGGQSVKLRPLVYDDVVILLRAAQIKAPQVAAMLRAAGVPAVAAGRESLLDCAEVRDLVSVLTLLGNRRQDLPLAAYLRGPLVGLDEATLLAIRRAAPGADFYEAVSAFARAADDSAASQRLQTALRRLEDWTVAARDAEVAALLGRIIADTEHDLFAAGRPGGAYRLAMLRSLTRCAEEFDRTPGGGCAEFADYLAELEAQETTLSADSTQSEGAVRVMTIHKAKGLEFPVVFLLAAGTQFNRTGLNGSLLVHEAAGIGLRFADRVERRVSTTAARELVRAEKSKAGRDEELRLLYVAATRARERLYVVGHTDVGAWAAMRETGVDGAVPLAAKMEADSHLKWLLLAAAARGAERLTDIEVTTQLARDLNGPTTERPPELPADVDGVTSNSTAELERELAVLRGRPLEQASRAPAVASVSLAKQRARGGGETEPDWEPGWVPAGLWADDMPTESDGRELGTACHRFLQFADLKSLRSGAIQQGEIARLRQAGRISETEAKLLPTDDLLWLGQSELGKQLCSGDTMIRREVPFTHAIPWPSADERMLMRGIIDCLIDSPTGLALLDYKTDRRVSAEDWERRIRGYSTQLQLYALAAGEIFGQPVVRLALVFLRERQVVEVEVAMPDLNELFGTAELA